MTVSKEQTNLMKGYAILFIFLHNFLHMRFCQENEMTFSSAKSLMFFQSLAVSPSDIIWNVISFIGWVGVPVFCFASGLGLCVKHRDAFDAKKFVIRNYLKLLFLMLPALLFYILVRMFFVGDVYEVIITLFQATMLQNLVCTVIPPGVAIYWYFGLTLQFYLLYILFRKYDNKRLLILGVGTVLLQLIIHPFADILCEDYWLGWIRHNFVGWLMCFILGILVARYEKEIRINKIIMWIVTLLSLPLMLVMNLNYYAWIFVPFVAIVFFYAISSLTIESKILSKIVTLVGVYSSCIFVCHPIARTVIVHSEKILNIPYTFVLVMIYVCITILLSYIYKNTVLRISNKIINRI